MGSDLQPLLQPDRHLTHIEVQNFSCLKNTSHHNINVQIIVISFYVH